MLLLQLNWPNEYINYLDFGPFYTFPMSKKGQNRKINIYNTQFIGPFLQILASPILSICKKGPKLSIIGQLTIRKRCYLAPTDSEKPC